MPGNSPHYGRWPQHDFTSLKKLRPQSVTSRIQPGSDVIVCAEMDEQWGYVGAKSRQFARMLGLEPKNTAVRSPESNGIAESFVKTIKRDYISIMPKPDGLTAAKNLAEAFEHYNEWHPHSALGYRSPREYLRQRASNGLSDNRCLE
ncbi:TPA: IS1 family transposase, partial [Escherichia coli]